MDHTGTPLALRAFVTTLACLAATAVVVAGWSLVPDAGLTHVLGLATGVLAVWIVQVGMRLRRFRGQRSEMYSYEEVLFPLLLVTVGPAVTVVSYAVGTTLVNLREHKSGLKLAFNVSQFTLAAAVGSVPALVLGIGPNLRGVVAVISGAAIFALLAMSTFGTLMSILTDDRWRTAVGTELRQTGGVALVEVFLGTTAAVGIIAVPALAPVAIVTIAVVLHMHRRWFQLARDREQIDDLLQATVSLHGSLTTDEVGRRLSEAIFTLISAEASLVPGETIPPAGGRVFDVDAGSAGTLSLVVRRDTQLDPTSIAICQALSRVAAVSYRMASLLEEREEQAATLRTIIDEREAFLSATAHQLRTPLTAMVGFSSLLWQEPDDPLVIKEMMSHLMAQAGEMTHHLDNLLVSSRALTDSVMISRDDVDLRTEVERAVAAMTPGRSLVSVVGGSTRAYVDPVRLRHILRNLLVNAQIHGGRAVEVHVGAGDDQVWIEVRDDGTGMTVAGLRSAFESPRVQGRTATSEGDVGLGLYVARLLARLMGGDVTYRRDEAWSVFRIEMPAHRGAESLR